MTDSQNYYKQVEAVALTGLTAEQSAEAELYIQRIVRDWLQQADEDISIEREEIVQIGVEDLQSSLAGKAGEARLDALHFQALKPDVQRTSGRAFELATQVADQKTAKADAAQEAMGLQERIHELILEVKLLADEDFKRLLMRELADADLEVRYILEDVEGAISIRLNRYING